MGACKESYLRSEDDGAVLRLILLTLGSTPPSAEGRPHPSMGYRPFEAESLSFQAAQPVSLLNQYIINASL